MRLSLKSLFRISLKFSNNNLIPNPNIYKINSNEFKSIITDELKELFKIFDKNNYELRIAGGAVRDLILNIIPKDIDLATNATPRDMINLFEKENIRLINLNGAKHGTVTCRINDKYNYEITTLRIDVKTYGRKADVQFTNDWYQDSSRRDLTINSMFLDLNGNIYDYFNGYNDLLLKRVKFVGNADKRIKEDFLRILRYFRFFSRIANEHTNFDDEAYEAIKANASGLSNISGERIWDEFKKILSQKYLSKIIKAFYDTKISDELILPKEANWNEFNRIIDLSYKETTLKNVTILSSLFNNLNELEQMHKRLKLSNNDFYQMAFIIDNRNKFKPLLKDNDDDELKYYKQALAIKSKYGHIIKPANINEIVQLLKYQSFSTNDKYIKQIEQFKLPKCPIDYIDLEELIPTDERNNINLKKYRKDINYLLREMRQKWIESTFKLTKEQLLKDDYLLNYLNNILLKVKDK